MKKVSHSRKLLGVFFGIYLILLLYFLLLKGNLSIFPENYTEFHQGAFQKPGNFNLVPLKTIRIFWNSFRLHRDIFSVANLLGNLIAFIPFGIFFPLLSKSKKTFLLTMLAGSCLILTIEFIQLITLWGILDIDDFIMNFIGLFLGWMIHLLWNKKD